MDHSDSSVREIAEKYHFNTYKRYPVTLTRGLGSRVWDIDGNEYIDALAGIGVNSVGHCHPRVVEAIREQAGLVIHISNLYYSEPQSRLAEQLARAGGMDRVFFCNSGAESVETAVKIARKFGDMTGKKGPIISMENCFHGRTIGTISLGKEKYRKGFGPMPGGIENVPFNDISALGEKMNGDTAAVIIEPVQGEGGIHIATDAFLKEARKLCDRHEALLIFDEIQCGVARSGKMFAWMHSGVKPDIFCTAKALGGGVPIGATLANEKAASCLGYGEHGTTFGGNPLACAAASAVLQVVEEENLCDAAREKGEYIMRVIGERTADWSTVKRIRGVGLMIGVELSFKGAPVVNKMLERGVLSNCASETVMRLLPPLVITQEETDTVIDTLLESIEECGQSASA
ncbi:MAG: aspartate aminotransferase family protein [Balneolaceae bacterium]